MIFFLVLLVSLVILVGLVILVLFCFLFESFENTADGVACRLKSGDHILDRRLEQSDNVGDEFVLGLDVDKCFEVLGAHIEALLNVSTLEQRLLGILVGGQELLDELGRGVVDL